MEKMLELILQEIKEVSQELNEIVKFLEIRDNKLEKKIDVKHKEYDYRITKLEFEQKELEERWQKIG